VDYYKVSENIGYLRGAVNIGVIKDGEKAILVDTGIDKGAAKEIIKALDQLNLTLEAIICTHHHADHVGGNAYIQNRTKVVTYASAIESGLIENPLLEPIYLFSGANPPQQLRNKFVLAKPSKVDKVVSEGKISFDEVTVKIIKLPGHSPNQIGVAIDDVLFCADTVFSMKVVEKYKLPFVQDVKRLKETLEKLGTSEYNYYVPSHARPLEDIKGLVGQNLKAINGIEERLLSILDVPMTTEQALCSLCDASDLIINGFQQYYLTHTLVTSYLGSLLEEGKIKPTIKDNLIYWEKKESSS